MPPLLAFRQDTSFGYPEFTAQGAGGNYQISKPPFAQQWRAAFLADCAAGERTQLERIGVGSFPTYDAAVAACESHRGRRHGP